MMQKFLLSFLLILLIIITSIAYLGNINQLQLNEYTIKITHSSSKDERAVTKSQVVETRKTTTVKNVEPFDYYKRYPFLNECDNRMSANLELEENVNVNVNKTEYDYSNPAANITYEQRILKAVLVYFPIELSESFVLEFKWLYRSWIEMIKYEPLKWRTDLVVFVLNDESYFNKSDFFLNELNCSFTNRRTSNLDSPMCTLIDYTPLRLRKLNSSGPNIYQDKNSTYDYLLNKLDIFATDDEKSSEIFYSFLQEKISNYGYVDSILMAFDGYSYLTNAGYHYLIRSDMDVFLTPLFSKWLPRNCSDFYVGRGGYSSTFNVNRLRRISSDLGLSYASRTNLGSTWYSTPHQFRLISYLTLFGMAYMSDEEFTPPEREGKLGVALWPYWHYGVLLLYGQNLFMNHLIATKQLNIVKLSNHLDYPAYYSEPVNKMLHIHVFHGDTMFSKFQFKAGKYDAFDYSQEDVQKAKFYALKMALEGKWSTGKMLYVMLMKEIAFKL